MIASFVASVLASIARALLVLAGRGSNPEKEILDEEIYRREFSDD